MSTPPVTNQGPNIIQSVLFEAERIKEKPKYLASIGKIFTGIVSAAVGLGVKCEPLTKAAVHVTGLCTMVSLTKSIQNVRNWCCLDKNGTYKWGSGGEWGVRGTVLNVCLTVADATDPFFFVDKIGLLPLGIVFQPLFVAKNVVLLFASTVGIIDGSCKLYDNDQLLEQQKTGIISEMDRKIKNWKVNEGDEEGLVQLFNSFKEKIRERKVGITADEWKNDHKIVKWSILLSQEVSQEFSEDISTPSAEMLNRFRRVINARVIQFEKCSERVIDNHYINRTRESLGLTVSISQFALGIIGLVGIVLAFFSIGVATTPAFIIGCIVGWTVTEVLSFTKSLYVDYRPVQSLLSTKDYQPLREAAAAA